MGMSRPDRGSGEALCKDQDSLDFLQLPCQACQAAEREVSKYPAGLLEPSLHVRVEPGRAVFGRQAGEGWLHAIAHLFPRSSGHKIRSN